MAWNGEHGKRAPFLVVILLGLSACVVAHGAVKIDGSLDVHWSLGSGTTQQLQFCCVVQGDAWRIASWPSGKTMMQGHRELAKQGTNLFLVAYRDPINTTNRFVRAKGDVSVDPTNSIPIYVEDFSHVIWMAYCRAMKSSCDFRGTGITSRLVYDMPPIILPCGTAWCERDASALRELKVINPGVSFSTSGKQYPVDRAYADGYCAAKFEAAEFTDVGGLLFPKSASWQTLKPVKGGASQDDLDVVTHVSIRTSSVTQVDDLDDVRPQVSGLMSVEDYRYVALAGTQGAIYLSTNGWWSPTEDRFKRGARAELVENKLTPFKRKVALFVFFGVSLLGCFCAFWSIGGWKRSRRGASASK